MRSAKPDTPTFHRLRTIPVPPMREFIVPDQCHGKSHGLGAQLMLLSMVMVWTKEIRPVLGVTWTRCQSKSLANIAPSYGLAQHSL
jgi:hypothetical protein